MDLNEKIIENVVNDDEEEEEDHSEANGDNSPIAELPTAVNGQTTVKSRKRMRGLRPNILERRIPSLYGAERDSQLYGPSEPLIIDDVRRSTMLDIDSETHVIKNELLIDSEINGNVCGLNKRHSQSSNRHSNRTVIVVDDQLINGSDLNNQTNSNPNDNSNTNGQAYEPLRILVKNPSNNMNSKNYSVSIIVLCEQSCKIDNVLFALNWPTFFRLEILKFLFFCILVFFNTRFAYYYILRTKPRRPTKITCCMIICILYKIY